MDHVIKSTPTFRRRKWFVLLFRVGIMGMIMLRSVASGDETGVPDTGLLCISDCATCPVICSPPPPKQSYTPPIAHHSPPPPLPLPAPSPPPEKSEPPPSSSWGTPPPPPSSSSWGTPPPPPSSSSWGTPPPPPPFKYNNYMPPAAGQGPPSPVGQHEYPYPYYYFYASDSSCLSYHAFTFLVILFYCVVVFFF